MSFLNSLVLCVAILFNFTAMVRGQQPTAPSKEYIYVGGRLIAIEEPSASVTLSIASISPTSGTINGGALVTISGTGFQSGATVTLGGAAATNVAVQGGTSMTATTPAHGQGLVDLVITNPDSHSVTLTGAYTYTPTNPPPTVTSISPASGTANGGTSITVTGTAFQLGASVSLGGTAATGVTVVSSTSITATTAAHAAGGVNVVVTNTDTQSGTLTNGFTYTNPPPTVTSISPASGSTAGGTSVTITGTGFVSGATVSLGGTAATGVTVVSSTSITATTAAHAAGGVNVVVTNTDTQSGTLTNGFTFTGSNPAPTVTGVTPYTGTVNGGTAITITGTGFQSGASVSLGGVAASGVTVVNSTSITAITPAHAAGSANVIVTNSDSQSGTLPNGYLYATGPVVGSLSPTSGTTAGGTQVTLSGSGFATYTNLPAATFGGVAATGVSVSDDSHIFATTPAHAAGVVDVVVTLNGNSGDHVTQTLSSAYTFTPPFSVTAISPNAGTINGSTAVTITGTGFVSGATVTLGGTAATGVTFVNSTSLTAITPAHAAGAVDVVVTNPGEQNATLPSGYTYLTPAPSVSSISPISGSSNGGTSVTLTGTGFLSGATVSLGGTAATGVTVVSSTSITATTAAHTAGAVNVVVTNTDTQSGTLANGFTYTNPVPSITSLNPSSVAVGSATFTLTVNGTSFVNGAGVQVNGSARTTTFVSSTQVTASIPAGDVATTGSLSITVVNPAPGGGTSNTQSFAVNNPAPTITSLNPSTVAVGSATFTLTVNGTNFISTSVVQVGGNSRVTTFVNSTQVTAAILASDVATAGSLSITVANPTPGGGTSNTATVSVVNPNPVPSIATISPTNVIAGSSGFTLTVNGANFVGASVVRVNGNNRTTTYISSVQLTAQIPSSDVVGAGSLSITVLNPTPGGGTSNSVTLTVNPANYSLSLDGTNNTYATAWGSSFAVSGAITVEGWIKTTSSSADILRCWDYGASGGYDLALTKTSVTFSILGKASASVNANVAISDGLWHHVAGVFDGNSPANVMVYVDGVLRGSSLWMVSLNSTSQTVTIGYYVNALLDEIRVTASAVYTGNFTPPRHLTVLPTTVALWNFDGLSTLDSTSFHNNLTLFGNATFSTDTP